MEGLLVVQDGDNTLPRAPQNFKLVPWSEVRRVLQLDP
jgi:3-phytase